MSVKLPGERVDIAGFTLTRFHAAHGEHGDWSVTHLPSGLKCARGVRTLADCLHIARSYERQLTPRLLGMTFLPDIHKSLPWLKALAKMAPRTGFKHAVKDIEELIGRLAP